jgi:2-methylcitrate dehydratase PrpD
MSYRFGKAMDYHRTLKDGQYVLAPVLGFSSTVFGATAAIGKLKGASPEVVANALGIAASVSPINTLRPYFDHTPIPTINYLLAGALTQAAMTAAHMAQLGHRGNLEILHDAEFGYRRFIGTGRWAPEVITAELGEDWRFPAEQTYKPYPHCRALHGLLDALTDVVATNDLKPSEIDATRAWGEGWVLRPVFLNRTIEPVIDGQFSSVHGLAVGAHRLTPRAAWQDPDVVFDPSVLGLMDKISFEPHQDWATAVGAHAAGRPSRVEVDARGATYTAETSYPHGTPSPDPGTMMTTYELAAKFRNSATNVITDEQIDHVVNAVLNLETITDIGTIMRGVSRAA